MHSLTSTSAGWFAAPLIGLVAVAYIVIAGRLTSQDRQAVSLPSGAPLLRFVDLYQLFGVGPFDKDEWPVLQYEANHHEDQAVARFKTANRSRPKRR